MTRSRWTSTTDGRAAIRWAGGMTLGAVVLGVTGFAPAGLAPDDAMARALAASVIAPSAESRSADGADPGEELGAEVVRQRHAQVRDAALERICGPAEAGREARFPLFDDVVVEAAEESRETIDGRLVWHGEVKGTSDQEVIVTLEGGCDGKPGNEYLSAEFLLGGALYSIDPDGAGRVTVSEISPLTDEDDSPVPPPGPGRATTRPVAGPPAKADPAVKAKCKGSDKLAVIDTLVAYTPKARTEAGGEKQIKAQIAKAVALANDAFATSGVKVRVHLVHTAAVKVSATYDTVSGASIAAFATRATRSPTNCPRCATHTAPTR
ncbi:hypothetical protein [Streptomyces sp. NBC_00203]|uniref:hypothetical protein n=1 Tax=Streptomyces sp. NBC_00203 TaxID=2975680 RepID=UPI00324E40D2